MHQQRYKSSMVSLCRIWGAEPFGGSGYTCGGLCVCHALAGWRRCCLKSASRLNKTTKKQEQCPTLCRCALYNLDGIIMPYMLNSFYTCQKVLRTLDSERQIERDFYNFISFECGQTACFRIIWSTSTSFIMQITSACWFWKRYKDTRGNCALEIISLFLKYFHSHKRTSWGGW